MVSLLRSAICTPFSLYIPSNRIIYVKQTFPYPPPSDLPAGYAPLEYVSGPIPIPCPLSSNNSVYLDYSMGSLDSRYSPRCYLFMGGLVLPIGSNVWFDLTDAKFLSLILHYDTNNSSITKLKFVEPDYTTYTQLYATADFTGRHKVYFHPDGGLFDSTLMVSGTSSGFWLGLGYTAPTSSSGASIISVGTFYGVSVAGEDEYIFYGIPCSNAEGVEGIYDAIGGGFYATRKVCTITRVSAEIANINQDTGVATRGYRYRATFPPLVDVTIANSVVYPAGVTEALLSSVTGVGKTYTTSPVYDDRYLYVYGGYVPE